MNSQVSEVENNTNKQSLFALSDQTYNRMKFVITLLFPGLSTLYFTIGTIWNFDYIEQVCGTIAAVTVFLGIFLTKSTSVYNKSDAKYDGAIQIIQDGGKKIYSLELNGDPNDIDQKEFVYFKIVANH